MPLSCNSEPVKEKWYTIDMASPEMAMTQCSLPLVRSPVASVEEK
jgi:hypothetical protein